MYNQWRHLLFVYPGIIIISSLTIYTLYEFLSQKNQYLAYTILGVFALSAILPTLHIFNNQALSFVYYNEAVGGVKPQFGKFETDYWGMSVKNGIDYLEQQGVLKPNMDNQVTIISNMGYALQTYTKKYGDKVKWLYASYPNRYKYKWDYALYTSLFVAGDQLRAGSWPMKSSTIHTINVGGVPVLAVMQQDTSQRVFKAQQLLKANNLPTAIEELKAEVAQHPDNDVALSSLAECYLNSANFAEAKTTVEALLKISPENATAYYMKGLAQAQLGDLNGATNSLQTCLKIAPEFSQALELLKQIRGQRR
jgi:tetratricopeptide (TPR) repeat protein